LRADDNWSASLVRNRSFNSLDGSKLGSSKGGSCCSDESPPLSPVVPSMERTMDGSQHSVSRARTLDSSHHSVSRGRSPERSMDGSQHFERRPRKGLPINLSLPPSVPASVVTSASQPKSPQSAPGRCAGADLM